MLQVYHARGGVSGGVSVGGVDGGETDDKDGVSEKEVRHASLLREKSVERDCLAPLAAYGSRDVSNNSIIYNWLSIIGYNYVFIL